MIFWEVGRTKRAAMTGYSLLNPKFNDFLFAAIGEERNEMRLSVLSALTRLGADPWQEAARLDQLPKELAAQSLASMIGDLPTGRWAPSDSGPIAARLIELLPSQNASRSPWIPDCGGVLQMIRPWALPSLVYAVLLATLSMVGGREPSSGTNPNNAPLTNAISPSQVPLGGSALEPTLRPNHMDESRQGPVSSRTDGG
jgi:hypothetical protein